MGQCLPMARQGIQDLRSPKQKLESHGANGQSCLGTEAGGNEGLNLPRAPYASEAAKHGSWDQPDSQGPCGKVLFLGSICPVWKLDRETHLSCFLPTPLPGQ